MLLLGIVGTSWFPLLVLFYYNEEGKVVQEIFYTVADEWGRKYILNSTLEEIEEDWVKFGYEVFDKDY